MGRGGWGVAEFSFNVIGSYRHQSVFFRLGPPPRNALARYIVHRVSRYVSFIPPALAMPAPPHPRRTHISNPELRTGAVETKFEVYHSILRIVPTFHTLSASVFRHPTAKPKSRLERNSDVRMRGRRQSSAICILDEGGFASFDVSWNRVRPLPSNPKRGITNSRRAEGGRGLFNLLRSVRGRIRDRTCFSAGKGPARIWCNFFASPSQTRILQPFSAHDLISREI